jgi:hypothetical protein
MVNNEESFGLEIFVIAALVLRRTTELVLVTWACIVERMGAMEGKVGLLQPQRRSY